MISGPTKVGRGAQRRSARASRETAGGRSADRLRIVFFGVWLIVAGAIVIANALR
jgi:hypothetical protein